MTPLAFSLFPPYLFDNQGLPNTPSWMAETDMIGSVLPLWKEGTDQSSLLRREQNTSRPSLSVTVPPCAMRRKKGFRHGDPNDHHMEEKRSFPGRNQSLLGDLRSLVTVSPRCRARNLPSNRSQRPEYSHSLSTKGREV